MERGLRVTESQLQQPSVLGLFSLHSPPRTPVLPSAKALAVNSPPQKALFFTAIF